MNNQQQKASIVFSDVSVWQELTKWLAGVLSAIALAFLGAVRWWVGDRFDKVDNRINSVEDDLIDAKERCSEHTTAIARMEVYSKTAEKDREKIHEKLDRIIERQVAGS